MEKLPVFMASLSNATVKNSIEITQSASDVKAIVQMLLQVANVSPNMTIDKTVMNVIHSSSAIYTYLYIVFIYGWFPDRI